MREILFRGKRKDNGEWLKGDLLQNVDCLKIREQEKCINHIARSFEVIPETAGQYTGLTDKNGNLVFEGDVIKWNMNYVVVWQNCKFVLKKDINAKPYDYVLSCFDGTEFEIIGNIHDNPELLEGDNDKL